MSRWIVRIDSWIDIVYLRLQILPSYKQKILKDGQDRVVSIPISSQFRFTLTIHTRIREIDKTFFAIEMPKLRQSSQ